MRNQIIVGAVIIAAVIAVGVWYLNYNSPYQTCVRAAGGSDVAQVYCARR